MQKVIPVAPFDEGKRDRLGALAIPVFDSSPRKSSSVYTNGNRCGDSKPYKTIQKEHDMDQMRVTGRIRGDAPLLRTSSSNSVLSTMRSLQQNISVRVSKGTVDSGSKIALPVQDAVKASAAPAAVDTGELMMNIIRSPIGLGHFLTFCESEFNSEYLQLFVAVERFRMKEGAIAGKQTISLGKEFSHQGKEYWRRIDDGFADSNPDGKNYKLDENRRDEIMAIWEKFFEDKDEVVSEVMECNFEGMKRRKSSLSITTPLSPNFVYLPKIVSSNTYRRLEHFDRYGADIFSEAVTEALRVLHRDIFPRFLKSESYEKIIKRRLSHNLELTILPTSTSLVVKAPRSEILAELGMRIVHAEGKMYSLHEILRDGILYNDFLTRMKKKGGAQYLLCYQLISLYKDSIDANESKEPYGPGDPIVDQAWNIYLYFIAEGSCHAIALPPEHINDIQLSLGNPSKQMFRELERVAMSELVQLFGRFKMSENYRNLASRALHTAKNILKIEAGTVRSKRSSRDQMQSMLTKLNIR